MWMLALLLACSDDLGGGPRSDDTGPIDTGDADSGDSGDPDDANAWWESELLDADADGYTMLEGDCDDANPAANPGVRGDVCNGIDDDCDGTVDEDLPDDRYEPNDESPENLGVLRGESIAVAYLYPSGDEDWFTFWLDDPDFDWFSMEVWIYNVPADVDVAIDLYWVQDPDGAYRGLVASGDRLGVGGDEWLDWGGLLGRDDSGWYEVRVRSENGYACDHPYTLQLLEGGI